MKFILLQDVKGVGRRNELKNVNDGYARNYLFARNLAVLATQHEVKKMERSHEEEHEVTKRLQEIKRLIEDRTIEFTLKSDGEGSPFG